MESLSMLVDKANATSGQDNITAVLYEHSSSEESRKPYRVKPYRHLFTFRLTEIPAIHRR